METRQVSRPASIVYEILRQERRGAIKKPPGFGDKGGGFRWTVRYCMGNANGAAAKWTTTLGTH